MFGMRKAIVKMPAEFHPEHAAEHLIAHEPRMRLQRMAMETMPVDRAWLDIGRWRRIKPGARVKARCAV